MRPELLAIQAKTGRAAGEILPCPSACQILFDKQNTPPRAEGCQAVEKPLESSRGPEALSNNNRPRRVNGGDGRIFTTEKSIFQSKNRFLAVFAAGIRRIQPKTGEGGRGGGDTPLSIRLSKLFDKQNTPPRAEGCFAVCAVQ